MSFHPNPMSNGQQPSPDEHAPYEPVGQYRADIDAAGRACNARDEGELDRNSLLHMAARFDRDPTSWAFSNAMTADERQMIAAALRLATRPAAPNDGAEGALADAVAALKAVQKLISEAAMTGFNCHDGDWAERLFHSQQATSAAIKRSAALTPSSSGGGEK